MQVQILSGIYTDGGADYRVSYPVNRVPVAKAQGISAGYLRPADGLIDSGTGPGADRGGILWDGVHYRVMGTKLVSVSSAGVSTTLGDVGTGGYCAMAYSYDNLAISSGGRLYYWNKTTLTRVTDVDLGTSLTVMYIDGYFVSTDGEFLIVSDLNDPVSFNILKYGSAEVDPDPVYAVLENRNELHAAGRYTIETYNNTGGANFPFTRVNGGHMQRGAVGTHAICKFADAIAFVGGGRNEAIGVYIGENGQTAKISTAEIDALLSTYTEAEQGAIVLEKRIYDDHTHLYMHLPDRTMVYDLEATKALGQFIWFTLTSALVGYSRYRARGLVLTGNKWWFGDPVSGKVGYLSGTTSHHFGTPVRWEFGTQIVYGEGGSAIISEMELVALTGRVDSDKDPIISTSYSKDGQSWSVERPIRAGRVGESTKRLVWLKAGNIGTWRIQRFRGTSEAHISISRLEMQVEGLGNG